MSNPQQRRWTAEEKLKILEEARQAGQSVSEVCRRQQIAPGPFYLWEKQARRGALQALRDGKRGRKAVDPTVRFETEITRLRATVAELSTENLQLKKGRWP